MRNSSNVYQHILNQIEFIRVMGFGVEGDQQAVCFAGVLDGMGNYGRDDQLSGSIGGDVE
ncbi:MAG: hypothetical protein HGJ94_05425 [Desulfosarcina sp.]|nr:hypothetical protein [Desulfosarcina sp.]